MENCSNILNGRDNKDKISATNKKYFETHAHPRLGVKHTEEARKKMIENRKPHKHSEETRKKLSQSLKGKNLGKRHTPEAIEKMRQNGIKNAPKL